MYRALVAKPLTERFQLLRGVAAKRNGAVPTTESKHLSEGLSPKLGGTAVKIVLFSFGEGGLFWC